jgi:hypothetical protein
MNAVSIAILAVVAALVVLALRAALRKDAGGCSCCSQKGSCPYSGKEECKCGK